MALDKQTIESLRFTLFHRKYYLAAEVDEALDRLIAQADEAPAPVQAKAEKPAPAPVVQNHPVEAWLSPAAPLQSAASGVSTTAAQQQAAALLQQAQAQSQQLLSQADAQRSRALAASRAAYYNALQFKQEIAQQYDQLARDMDGVIELLRSPDEPSVPADPQEQ